MLKKSLFFLLGFLLLSLQSFSSSCLTSSQTLLSPRVSYTPAEAQKHALKLTHGALEIRPGSIAYDFPDSIGLIEDMDKMMPRVSDFIKQNLHISKYDIFNFYINAINDVAIYLKKQSKLFPNRSLFFAESLEHTYKKMQIPPEKVQTILARIEQEGGRLMPYESKHLPREIQERNQSQLSGLLSAFWGERGELLASLVLTKIEARSVTPSAYLAQIDPDFEKIDRLIIQYRSLAQGDDRYDQLQYIIGLVRTKADSLGRTFDEKLFSSFLNKEVDLIRDQGRQWVEVKNYKHPVTAKSLEGHDKEILKQAIKTRHYLEMFGIEDKVDLRIVFINCISESGAKVFWELARTRALGCIVPDHTLH